MGTPLAVPWLFPVPRGRKSIARVRKPLETGTNTSQNPNGVNVGWNCDQSRARVGLTGIILFRVAAEVTFEFNESCPEDTCDKSLRTEISFLVALG